MNHVIQHIIQGNIKGEIYAKDKDISTYRRRDS